MSERGLGDKTKNLPISSPGAAAKSCHCKGFGYSAQYPLADEPTGALDQKTGAQVMQLFEDLNKEGSTIIMITHDEYISQGMQNVS